MSKEDPPLTQETGVSVQHHKAQHSGVWFFTEHKDGKPEDSTLRLAGEAKNLAAKLGQEACALVLGHQVKALPEDLGLYAVDRVLLVDDPHLDTYSSETYVDALAQLAESHRPSIVLFSSTPLGNDLAPRLAARIRASFAARYTEIGAGGEGELTVRRAVHGGNADATATSLRQPLVATIDPQSLSLQKAKQETNPVVTEPNYGFRPEPTRQRRSTTSKQTHARYA